MARSQVKIDLIFQANTQAALSNIQQLNNLLHQISTNTTIGINSGSISQAVQSAQQLQAALATATNVDTGKLDLTKLNSSLQQAGTNLRTLASNLQALGPQGQQTFIKLANSVAQAQAPMFQLNEKLRNFGTTLVNTIKWQLASTLIHGVTNSIREAVSYTKELNGALNDIRIVTGKSIEEMSRFAEQATKSAKALNSTTKEYAEAALIFYQQGLDGDAVTERAEVVLKLAQVTGQSAEIVSDQMTAVWNNFYDGSKSLQYYADVVTALGAATASSSDEIIQGLEKFAATAETIGLSYDYAAASLATVVAETRQAPEVVGNAFKTLFARLQGLKLGETLEDGVDLNKYSEALESVGVDIIKQNGELKNAQEILQETAATWETLTQAEQVALAQTVGGMRQYTQFIALMENWEGVELNVTVAELSEGTLTEQQETWSESWAAASKRVQQSKNELSQSIVNDDFMIKLSDIWSELIDGFKKLMENAGGLIPFISTIIAMLSTKLFPILQNGFTRLRNNISVLTGSASRQVAQMQSEISAEIQKMVGSGTLSKTTEQQLLISDKLIKAKQELARSSKNLSIAEKEAAERKLAIVEAMGAEIQKSLEHQAAVEQEIKLLEQKIIKTKEYQQGAAEWATKTGESKKLSDKQYASTFGASREEISSQAATTTKYSTTRSLKLNDNQKTKEMAEISRQQEQRRAIDEKKNQGKELTEYEKIADKKLASAEELNKKEKERLAYYEQQQKKLEEILRIQNEIAGKGTSATMGKTAGEFNVTNKPQPEDNKQVFAFKQDLQANAASQLNGTVQPARDEKGQFTGEQTVVADASLDNLKKAYQLQGKYTAALTKTKSIQTDVQNATVKYKEALEKSNKALQKNPIKKFNKEYQQAQQTIKSSITTLKSSESQILALAKDFDIGEEATKQLKEAFKMLDDEATATEGMQKIDTILGELGVSFNETKDGVSSIIAKFDELLRGKIPDEILDELKRDFADVGNSAAHSGDQIDQFNKKTNGLTSSSLGFGKAFSTISTSLVSIAGAAQSAMMGFKSLSQAFEEGNTPMENFSNYLMGIMSLLPIITTLTQVYSSVSDTFFKKKQLQNKKEQESDLQTAAVGAFKSSVSSFGWVGIAIGAALAIAIIAGAILSLKASKPKEDEGAKKEKALGETIEQLTNSLNEAKDAAENFKKAISDYEDGIKSLEDLDQRTQEYRDTLESVNEKARELINAHNLLKGIDYEFTAEGLLKISSTALAAIQNDLNTIVRQTEIALTSTQMRLTNTKADNWIKHSQSDFAFKDNYIKNSNIDYDNDDDTSIGEEERIIFSNDEKLDATKVIYDNKIAYDQETSESGVVSNVRRSVEEIRADLLKFYKDDATMYAKIQGASDVAIESMVAWSDSLTKGYEANQAYANKILGLIAEDKFGTMITERLMDEEGNIDQGKYNLYMGAADVINKNNSDKEYIDKISNYFDDTNTEIWGNTIDNYDTVGLESGYDSEMYNVNEIYDKFDLDYDTILRERYGVGLNDLKTTADLAKVYYEERGYRGVEIEDNDGTLVVSYANDAEGNGPGSLDEINNTQMTRAFMADQEGYLINAVGNQQGFTDEEMSYIFDQIEATGADNEFGVNFANATMAAIANENGDYDLSSLLTNLTSDEMTQIENMKPEDIEKMLGITPEIKEMVGSDLVDKMIKNVQGEAADYLNGKYDNKIDKAFSSEAKKLELDPKVFEIYRNSLKQTNPELAKNKTLLNQVAIANMRLDRGVKGLADNWDDLTEKMNSDNIADQAEAAVAMEEHMRDILNFSEEDWELLPQNFVQDNWSLIQDVVNGVPGAVQEMRRIANSEKILFNIDTALDPDNTLKNEVQNLHDWFINYDFGTIQPGVKIQDEFFYQQLEAMSLAAKMTEQDLQDYLASWDLEAKIVEIKDSKGNVIGYKVESNSAKKSTSSWNDYSNNVASDSARAGAGGDSSPAEKVERTKKSDIVERFKETEDVLDDIADSMDRINGQMDRMYGASRLKAMDKELELLENEAKVLEQQRKENDKYLKEDKKALETAAKEAGVRFNIDANGNITNYTEEMTRLYDQLAQAEEKMSKMSTKEEQDAYQENVINPLMDRINNVSDAAEIWSESVEKDEELLQKIEENLYERQDKEFKKLQYEVEFKIELNEEDLAIIDYYFKKYADDIYTAAEQAATFGDKIQNTLDKGKIYEDQLASLNEKYEQGLISDADYAESLGEIQGNLIEVNQELLQYQEDMENFYGETLQLAMEEIEKYTGKFENMIGVLEHYRTIIDLMGKSSDYKMIDKVLENKQTILNNKLSTSKETYDTLLDQEQALLNQLNNSNLTETERAVIEKALEDLRAQMNETYDTMLSDAEAAMENLAEILANNIEKANKQLEGVLTGGRSFDALNTTAERLQGSQEEYLTTTNKIYETTKMIRNIQNEIDKTTNNVAKQRLKAFQEQTQLLQNQSKLSQFELDIQQKKYDLLLAEIALEEAQNAKSVVRLQRDSEGNFGYVYTASQEDVSSAQQGVDDANNALYNARLEGANNYALQYQEIMSQLHSDLAALQEARKSGEITTEEEYERRKLEIIEYYSDKLTTVSDLYSFAIAEDAKVAEEAWSSSLKIMDMSNEIWIEAVEEYLDKTEDYFEDFQNSINIIAEDYGLTMEDMCESSNEMADSSIELANTINTEVLGAISNELYAVQTLMQYMAKSWGPTMDGIITKYEQLLPAINNVKNALSTLDTAATQGAVFTKKEELVGDINTIIDEFNKWLNGLSGKQASPKVEPTASYTDKGYRDKLTLDNEKYSTNSVTYNNKFKVGDSVGPANTAWFQQERESPGGATHAIKYPFYIEGPNGVMRPATEEESYTSYTAPDTSPDAQIYTMLSFSYIASGYNDPYEVVDHKYYGGQNFYKVKYKNAKISSGWIEESNLAAYDTGGYTGEWGPEGKWALLHQKELVLNAHQTEDLLITMELLDSIIKQIDMMTMNNKISQMHAAMNEAVNAIYKEQMAQEVHIEANFPNATDRNEIYQALELLANDASQFINR